MKKILLVLLTCIFSTGLLQAANFTKPHLQKNSQSVRIIDNSIYSIPPEFAPYMPDNGPMRNVPPFEWHKSQRELTDEYDLYMKESNERAVAHEQLKRAQSPAYALYKDFRMLGLTDQQAKDQVLAKFGVI